ncbi:hypothetical protein BB559_002018 [Furculomyces boomerangus]|uniref:Uncharacterized protein n=2 Tax=Harpellales TaxID=61421 RepID=A0A2T9YYU0_9FUNG|nr:hypothetical protein BB559_002018 [Furculomyces boomerangus]PWA03117.1 hypothetical protein BB558_000711 [Smittium angustum]
MERLRDIEQQDFVEKKREFYKRRSEIKTEIKQILLGVHPVFNEMVSKLERTRDRELELARSMFDYKMRQFDQELKSQRAQALIDFENERKQLINQLVANIEEKRRKIKDEKDSLEVTSDYLLETSRGSNKRSLRNRGLDTVQNSGPKPGNNYTSNARRKQTLNFPINGLAEEEIISDLVQIRKYTGVVGPLALPTTSKKNLKSNKR